MAANRRRRDARALSRWNTVAATLLYVLATAGLSVGAITTYDSEHRSSYTQSHGITVEAKVVSVTNSHQCLRTCFTTFAASAQLLTPVKGVVETTIHGPNRSTLETGRVVAIKLNPENLAYAELPGETLDTSGWWIPLAVVAAVFYLPVLAFFWGIARVGLRSGARTLARARGRAA